MPASLSIIIFDYLQSIYSMDLIKYSVHFVSFYHLSDVREEIEFALSVRERSDVWFVIRSLKSAE